MLFNHSMLELNGPTILWLYLHRVPIPGASTLHNQFSGSKPLPVNDGNVLLVLFVLEGLVVFCRFLHLDANSFAKWKQTDGFACLPSPFMGMESITTLSRIVENQQSHSLVACSPEYHELEAKPLDLGFEWKSAPMLGITDHPQNPAQNLPPPCQVQTWILVLSNESKLLFVQFCWRQHWSLQEWDC